MHLTMKDLLWRETLTLIKRALNNDMNLPRTALERRRAGCRRRLWGAAPWTPVSWRTRSRREGPCPASWRTRSLPWCPCVQGWIFRINWKCFLCICILDSRRQKIFWTEVYRTSLSQIFGLPVYHAPGVHVVHRAPNLSEDDAGARLGELSWKKKISISINVDFW